MLPVTWALAAFATLRLATFAHHRPSVLDALGEIVVVAYAVWLERLRRASRVE